MKKPIVLLAVAVLSAAAVTAGSFISAPAAEPGFKSRPAYRLLERLLRVPEGIIVRQDSSHNKRGVNDDANQPLYKDPNGDDVIFDSAGPGCIRSFWSTAFDPKAVLRFYFDGEAKPRHEINAIEFFQGRNPLFPAPLNSYARRGYWGDAPFAGNSFVPIRFEKSLKIAVHGESRFFHIISERHALPEPDGSRNEKADRAALEDAFARLGERPFDEDGLRAYTAEKEEIAAGEIVPLLKTEAGSGIVREIEIEADGSEEFFRQTRIRLR